MSEHKFPGRIWITNPDTDFLRMQNLGPQHEWLHLTEHQHILAEKEKRIEKLSEALKFYSGGEMSDIDMDIFDKIRLNTKDPKHVYVEWVDTEWLCNPARAALQEDGK